LWDLNKVWMMPQRKCWATPSNDPKSAPELQGILRLAAFEFEARALKAPKAAARALHEVAAELANAPVEHLVVGNDGRVHRHLSPRRR
jgi:hypothetical protein